MWTVTYKLGSYGAEKSLRFNAKSFDAACQRAKIAIECGDPLCEDAEEIEIIGLEKG